MKRILLCISLLIISSLACVRTVIQNSSIQTPPAILRTAESMGTQGAGTSSSVPTHTYTNTPYIASPTFTPLPPMPTFTPGPPTPTSATSPKPTSNKQGSVYWDVPYCSIDGVDLKMDVYYPDKKTGPWPVIVYIHGGGFTSGDKHGGVGLKFIDHLVAADYLVVAINYRLAPKYIWPAMVEDVKCAIRSLRANASVYNLDPNRIGVYGTSAGGYLASILGTADSYAGFDDVGDYQNQSSQVQAVIDMFGPIDIKEFCLERNNYGDSLFGKNVCDDQALMTAFSPMTYASWDDPPFMLIHGDQDSKVPLQQSQTFYNHLKNFGIPAYLIIVNNAGHTFSPTGGEISPSIEEIIKIVIGFFDMVLK